MTDMTDDVDEHPIIFNEWSIRRILAGEKTQTRRIMQPQPSKQPRYNSDQTRWQWRDGPDGSRHELTAVSCPYGQPGDVLWVREAFRLPVGFGDESPTEAICAKDCQSEADCDGDCHAWKFEADATIKGAESRLARAIASWGRKRPSIHMPKELCRLRLPVEDVRVERVQEISLQDAIAEGVGSYSIPGTIDTRTADAVQQFRELWNDIHGDGAWERNDWVWVVEFSCIDAE